MVLGLDTPNLSALCLARPAATKSNLRDIWGPHCRPCFSSKTAILDVLGIHLFLTSKKWHSHKPKQIQGRVYGVIADVEGRVTTPRGEE